MNNPGHLRFAQVKLAPGQEWCDQSGAWRFLRLGRGAGYWLDTARPRSFNEGELAVVPPGKRAVVRASQLNDVLLEGFAFAPDLLCGFFTMAERHFFEQDAAATEDVRFLPSTHPLTERFGGLAARHRDGRALAERTELLGLALAYFADGLARQQTPQTRTLSAHYRFQQIISEMPDLELIHHTPEQLAQLCGCSPRHFNRLFRERFGESPRARQTELRLLKARQLLVGSDTKIIQVALDSGYRSLSLFNALFKRRFGMSPSEWRHKAARTKNKLLSMLALGTVLLGAAVVAAPVPGVQDATSPFTAVPEAKGQTQTQQQKALDALHDRLKELQTHETVSRKRRTKPSGVSTLTNTPPPSAVSTNGRFFEVKGYQLIGNTLLPPAVTDPILRPHTGKAVNFDSIRKALADLQLAYRERGFVTVALSLPPQQLTNGMVKVDVTEGRVVQINVLNNHYFSSNNVMRDFPSLRTNDLLNALVFQQELDRANANRDRQIYPVLSPGPDPGTTVLDLKVKDRLPFHAHLDVNDYSTPGTPELRANFAAVYDNLWQLDHQVGLQYSFSPEAYKQGDFNFYDEPLIANYSAYYRAPLSGVNGPSRPEDYSLSSFGYNEATRHFQPPPPTGASELLFYASRSSSDTGTQLQSATLTPAVLPPEGGLQISDLVYDRTLNPNEDVGARLTTPLPPLWGFASTFSGGPDYKNYRSTLVQSRTFSASIFVPDVGNTGPPFTEFPSPPISTQRTVFTSVRYLPFSLTWEASESDRTGSTSVSLGQSFNFSGVLSGREDFQAVANSVEASGNYYVLAPSVTREQKLVGDWGVRFHADGQWANEPLISNEQMSFGGLAGPRGYRDGALYGDTGWRVQVEPHSPYLNRGLAFDKIPILVRVYTFVDYGQSYLLDPQGRSGSVSLLGTGAGMDLSIGEHFDCRVNLGVPLLDIPGQEAGHPRVEFSIGTQW